MSPYESAKRAVDWHKEQVERGDEPWSCRLYDGKDTGPANRRCWLVPGHQCDCMTEREARALVARGSK